MFGCLVKFLVLLFGLLYNNYGKKEASVSKVNLRNISRSQLFCRSSNSKTQYKKLHKESDSEEETELLFVRRNKVPKNEIPTIDKEIDEGDTLQSLAIRYHCTVSVEFHQ